MSATLLSELGNATGSFNGYLGELWTVWTRDVARAVLLARWSWQRLPEELIQQAAAMQQQAQSTGGLGDIERQVDTRLGAMGIFPGPRPPSVMSFGSAVDPGTAMFITVMSMIRAYKGDPPIETGLSGITEFAESVLKGKMDPVKAMIDAAPSATKQQIVAAVDLMKTSGMDQFVRVQAFILVTFALPRKRIPILLPEVVDPGQTVSLEADPQGTPEHQLLGMLQTMKLLDVGIDIRLVPWSIRRIIALADSAARANDPKEHLTYLWVARKRLYDLLKRREQDVYEVVTGDETVLERIAREEGLWQWSEADIAQHKFGSLFKEYDTARREKDQNAMNNYVFLIAGALAEVLWARGRDTNGIDFGKLDISDLEERVRREGLYE